MQLSYWLRLVVWTLFNQGMVLAVLSTSIALVSFTLRKRIASQTARWQERYWLTTALTPHIVAALTAIAIAAPAYSVQEYNTGTEHVGLLCLFGAFATAALYLHLAIRGIGMACQSMRDIDLDEDTSPLPVTRCTGVTLAVIGILRPRIAASPVVLQGNVFSGDVFEVALSHEASHIQHRDNLKLFLLATLSPTGRFGAQVQRWQRMAERAADDDAVQGQSFRAVLLAEALVVAARVASGTVPPLSMELLPRDNELESRVNRLLNPALIRTHNDSPFALQVALAASWLTVCIMCALLTGHHDFAEFIFRLG